MEADAVALRDGDRPVGVVGIGASAGGVEALREMVTALPAGFPGAVCVTLHIPATGRSALAAILDRHSRLTAVQAAEGMRLQRGVIYVAPADRHLIVGSLALELGRGPKENGTRPAADPMFRSLAASWGPAAVAVVLSGALDDGSAGAVAVAAAGGTVIVQDPEDALVSGMPSSVIAADSPEHVVPAGAIGGVLAERFTHEPVSGPIGGSPMPEPLLTDAEPPRPDGPPSAFTCPECSGALWELREGQLVGYQCRVGHRYSEEAMIEAQGASVEAALWTALEVLEERGELLDRIAGRMDHVPRTQQRLRSGARGAHERAGLIRRALLMGAGRPAGEDIDEAAG